MQVIITLLVVAVSVVQIPFVYLAREQKQKYLENVPADYHFPVVSDFKGSIPPMLGFFLLEQLIDKHLYKLFRPLCKIQDDFEEREVRSRKMAINYLKISYYLGNSLYFYYVIAAGQDWLPEQLGGTAPSMERVLARLPYPPYGNQMQNYFLVITGYHWASLFGMFFCTKRRDWIEMMLHHTICLFLFSGGYLMNIVEAAGLVAFLHDASDVFITLAKIFGETNYEKMNIIIFLVNMVTWGYNRIYYLPVCIYEIHTFSQTVTDWNRFCVFNFTFNLSCLWVLHVYWYSIFIRILYKYFSKGHREDLVQKTEMQTNPVKAKTV